MNVRGFWEAAAAGAEQLMFSYLSGLLYRFQSKPVQTIALAALAVLVSAVLLGSLVRWLRRRGKDRPEGWAALFTSSLGAVLKVLIGLAALAGVCAHLAFQSTEFARLRGGTSARNYEAVTSIWGRPHLQRELSVRLLHETTHFFDKDGLELDPNVLKAASQPVGYRKQVVEHVTPGNPVTEAEHEFAIAVNYRPKGGALYPGFETDAAFSYKFANFADRELTASFSFPMPAGQGLVDQIQVLVDGKPVGQRIVINDSAISWKMPVKAHATHALTIRYHSRGLNDLRFEPGAGREMEKYRIRMVCRGIAKDQVNYPSGCMTPTEPVTERLGKGPDGQDTPILTLAWNLERAITRLGMGVIIPPATQEGYYVARVLATAPWGLILLLAIVLVTHLATGSIPHWLPLAILAASYHLYYLLMAHVGDYAPGLVGGMVIAGVVLTALTALFQLVWCRRFHAAATIALFLVFCVAYPLLRISDYEGLLLTILYVALLAYTIALLISQRRAGRFAEPAA